LSEGDKSTLALAFFLAKLDIDPSKADKIIILDDPLSSFDRNRRMYTVDIIHKLIQEVKQVVVLSHNELFIYEIFKGAPAGNRKELRINENFTTGTSSIEEFSIEQLVEIDYFKHIKQLEDFLSNADITKKENVLGLMRNVLESNLRFKFYRQAQNDTTLGKLITTLDSAGVVFRDNTNRADIISKLRLINGISSKPHHGEPVPDYNILGLDPSTITATELAHTVQDTLDLIDRRI
jgi:wobble nucleotide-excising tRNase